MLWKFLVGVFPSFDSQLLFTRVCISFEISTQCCTFMRCSSKDCVDVLIRIEGDHVLTWQVDLEMNDTWHLSIHVKLIDMVASFHIPTFCVPLNFISVIDLKGCEIWAFLNIFEEVFERSKRCCALNIDVTVKCCRKKWAERNDPPVVHTDTSNQIWVTIIWMKIDWKTMFVHGCECCEWFRISLHAFAIFHARWIRVHGPAWPMNHTPLDRFEQQWLGFGIWPSCPNAWVNCLGRVELVRFLQKNENVYMQ